MKNINIEQKKMKNNIKSLKKKAEILGYCLYYDKNIQSWITKKNGENKEFVLGNLESVEEFFNEFFLRM